MVSSGKVTGSVATQRTKPVAGTVSSATRKPVTRVVNGKRLTKYTHSKTLYKEQEQLKKDNDSEIQCVNKQKIV